VRLRGIAYQLVQLDQPHFERSRGVQRALVVEQLLDQALQLHAVVAHDGDDLHLRRRERARDPVVQQLGAFRGWR